MDSCSNPKKVLNKSKYILYLRLFKVDTPCIDDNFAHSWHSLNQLHEVDTWNASQLTGVPCSMLIGGISFLMCLSQSSAVAKNIKCYDETGYHETRHRKGRPRVTSAA